MPNTRVIVRRERAEKKHRRHGRRKFTLPVAAVAGFIPLASDVYYNTKAGGLAEGVKWIKFDLLGIDGNGHFNAGGLSRGLFPILGGFAIHGLANKFGINRALGRMGIPIIRI